MAQILLKGLLKNASKGSHLQDMGKRNIQEPCGKSNGRVVDIDEAIRSLREADQNISKFMEEKKHPEKIRQIPTDSSEESS